MPIGIQRLNAKKSQPNDRIIFIKPLKGPDEAIAQDFLERIAAQCLPIMKENHLSVMCLEEYEPNAEFVGRNFNAGEVIQLVLKARFTGHWLPFNYVQMVMMHELAHCKQMNHSRAFWAVRNTYADRMRQLWANNYTGEGLWGRGALLSTGEFERNAVAPGESLPEHLCGGTYRSRGRKRKVKEKVSYQEQKERRILKKFGKGGVTLGEDEKVKRQLEGKRVGAKPRVAGSQRGRELRAQAALARFEKKDERVKEEEGVKEEERVKEEGSETESGSEYDEDEVEVVGAVDLNGQRLLDVKGRGMVKVCEDEDPSDGDAQKELLELLGFGLGRKTGRGGSSMSLITGQGSRDEGSGAAGRMKDKPKVKEEPKANEKRELGGGLSERISTAQRHEEATPSRAKVPMSKESVTAAAKAPIIKTPSATAKPTISKQLPATPESTSITCPICSFANDKMAPTCGMCSNILQPKTMPGAWACTSQTCWGSKYRNAQDCGICGVCGERKPVGS